MKIAFDVGGVLSKYPNTFRPLLYALLSTETTLIEVYIISDMHPKEKIIEMLRENNMRVSDQRINSADYKTHGENCKAVLCKELGIDILIDDFPGYVATPNSPLVRLLVMPDPSLPYFHDSWKTDGSEGNFGRRKKSET